MNPRVSFIVLSYNYRQYIGRTIESILNQTVNNIEVIVIDDNSTDDSVEVIKSYKDDRIRLIRNEVNIGGAASFNKAYEQSRGDFIATVDSDDWIEPTKTAKQLMLAEANSLDIIGTWVNFVGADGHAHPEGQKLEQYGNRDHDFNMPNTWIVQNNLCRSSSLVKRSFHEKYGLADVDLVRTPDLDLWLRALRNGLRFGLVQEKLTNYRLHTRGVTHADPAGTYLEFAFIFRKNMIPLLDQLGDQRSRAKLFDWFMIAPQALELTPRQRYRMFGFLAGSVSSNSFQEFRTWIYSHDSSEQDAIIEEIGKNFVCLLRYDEASTRFLEAQSYHLKVQEARDWWRGNSNKWRDANKESRQLLKKEIAERKKIERRLGELEKQLRVAISIRRRLGAIKRSVQRNIFRSTT